jgi:hypothetical protein
MKSRLKEMHEGTKAKERFERVMTTLFKIPKPERAEKITKKPKKGKD